MPLLTAATCHQAPVTPKGNSLLPAQALLKHALQHSLHPEGTCLFWFHSGCVLLQVEQLEADVGGKHAELLAVRKALEQSESQVRPCHTT